MNGLIANYALAKTDSPIQKLQYEYEIVKLKIEEFEVDTEIAAKDQSMKEYQSRQSEHNQLQFHADEIMKNLDALIDRAESLTRNMSVPAPARDRIKAMLNAIHSPDFIGEKQSVKNKAIIRFKMEVDNLTMNAPSKIKLVN